MSRQPLRTKLAVEKSGLPPEDAGQEEWEAAA